MAKFYRVMGVVSIIGCIISFFVLIFQSFLAALITLGVGVISVFPWFTLASLLDRVDALEWGYRKSPPASTEVPKPKTPSTTLKDALDW